MIKKAVIPRRAIEKILDMVEVLAPGFWLMVEMCFVIRADYTEKYVPKYVLKEWYYGINGRPVPSYIYDNYVSLMFPGGEDREEARKYIMKRLKEKFEEVELV